MTRNGTVQNGLGGLIVVMVEDVVDDFEGICIKGGGGPVLVVEN